MYGFSEHPRYENIAFLGTCVVWHPLWCHIILLVGYNRSTSRSTHMQYTAIVVDGFFRTTRSWNFYKHHTLNTCSNIPASYLNCSLVGNSLMTWAQSHEMKFRRSLSSTRPTLPCLLANNVVKSVYFLKKWLTPDYFACTNIFCWAGF